MKGNTHAMIALATGTVIANACDIPFREVGWLTLLFSSLLPDIDEPSSYASRPGGVFLPIAPKGVQNMINVLVKVLMFPIRLFTKHRGVTHAPMFLLLLSGVMFSIAPRYWIWFTIGYGTHLFADYLTPMGIPLFFPVSDKRFSRPICRTGSWVEWLIFLASGLLFCYGCYVNLEMLKN